MKKFLAIAVLSGTSAVAHADRYGMYDDPEIYGSGGSSGLLGAIGAVACIAFAFWFIKSSFIEWKARRATGEKIERKDILVDVVAPFIGYALVAFFLSVPFAFAIKFLSGVAAVKEYWFVTGLACFGVVAFLRQT